MQEAAARSDQLAKELRKREARANDLARKCVEEASKNSLLEARLQEMEGLQKKMIEENLRLKRAAEKDAADQS